MSNFPDDIKALLRKVPGLQLRKMARNQYLRLTSGGLSHTDAMSKVRDYVEHVMSIDLDAAGDEPE